VATCCATLSVVAIICNTALSVIITTRLSRRGWPCRWLVQLKSCLCHYRHLSIFYRTFVKSSFNGNSIPCPVTLRPIVLHSDIYVLSYCHLRLAPLFDVRCSSNFCLTFVWPSFDVCPSPFIPIITPYS
jgi:hypothetical protein